MPKVRLPLSASRIVKVTLWGDRSCHASNRAGNVQEITGIRLLRGVYHCSAAAGRAFDAQLVVSEQARPPIQKDVHRSAPVANLCR